MPPKSAIAFAMLAIVALSANAVTITTSNALGAAMADAKKSIPPIDSPAKGSFLLSDPDANGIFTYKISVQRISQMTMAHIHYGNATTNGPPAVTLIPLMGAPAVDVGGLMQLQPPVNISAMKSYTSNFTTAAILGGEAEGMTADEFVAYMKVNDMYVNFHTVEYPAGIIHGQIKVNKDSSGASPAIETSPAVEASPSEASPAEVAPAGNVATKSMVSDLAVLMVAAAAMF